MSDPKPTIPAVAARGILERLLNPNSEVARYL
jgi:hypothetical protein